MCLVNLFTKALIRKINNEKIKQLNPSMCLINGLLKRLLGRQAINKLPKHVRLVTYIILLFAPEFVRYSSALNWDRPLFVGTLYYCLLSC